MSDTPLQPPLCLVGDFPRLVSLRPITELDAPLYELAAWVRAYGASLDKRDERAGLALLSALLSGWPGTQGSRHGTRALRELSDHCAELATRAGATRADVADAWDLDELGAKQKLRRDRRRPPAPGSTLEVVPVLGEAAIAILEQAGIGTAGRVITPEPLDPAERLTRRLGIVHAGDVPLEQVDLELERMTAALYAGLRRTGVLPPD